MGTARIINKKQPPCTIDEEYEVVLHDQGLLDVKVKESAGLGTTEDRV